MAVVGSEKRGRRSILSTLREREKPVCTPGRDDVQVPLKGNDVRGRVASLIDSTVL